MTLSAADRMVVRAAIVAARRPARRLPRKPCVYCGWLTPTVSPACEAHDDLVGIDPWFTTRRESIMDAPSRVVRMSDQEAASLDYLAGHAFGAALVAEGGDSAELREAARVAFRLAARFQTSPVAPGPEPVRLTAVGAA